MPIYRVNDSDLAPDLFEYRTPLPVLEDDEEEILQESTWLPGLRPDAREEFLNRIFARSKTYLSQIREEGPCGWKNFDPSGTMKWTSSLRHSRVLKAIARSDPLSGDLTDEVPYRYSRIPLRADE